MLLCPCTTTRSEPICSYSDDTDDKYEDHNDDGFVALSLDMAEWATAVFARALEVVFAALLFGALVMPVRSAEYLVRHWWSAVRRSANGAYPRCPRALLLRLRPIAVGLAWTAAVIAANSVVLAATYWLVFHVLVQVLRVLATAVALIRTVLSLFTR